MVTFDYSQTIQATALVHDAYVRLVKAQVEFPQILSAYDAVSQWIDANGKTITGSPREVYFADFGAAASSGIATHRPA
jgi:hypothetical protein